MKIVALVNEDFRTADSGSRIRDYALLSRLAAAHDVVALGFAQRERTPGIRQQEFKGRSLFMLSRPTRSAALRSVVKRTLYHSQLFDFSLLAEAFEQEARDADVIYASMIFAMEAMPNLLSKLSS